MGKRASWVQENNSTVLYFQCKKRKRLYIKKWGRVRGKLCTLY